MVSTAMNILGGDDQIKPDVVPCQFYGVTILCIHPGDGSHFMCSCPEMMLPEGFLLSAKNS